MNKISHKNLLLLGITLFSMFFGAGNLIFPPFLGFEAGTNTLPAFIGFVITAVVFPVLGVVAAARVGGIDKLCEKIHPLFGRIFTLIIYICIGPLLAIPRTAGTSYAMFGFVTERAGDGAIFGLSVQLVLSIGFSALFFLAAGLLARNPEKLKDVLGKRMTPVLLFLIAAMFVASLLHPELTSGAPTERYATGALAAGFVDGYQTMDTLAAMVFGIVIGLDAIISFSSPILSLIYPVALVIIALNLIPLRFVQTKIFFRAAVLLAFVYSLWSLLA